jgi:hypothetical protein
MNGSVVTHPSTAWWRSHRATSRCTAGRVLRRDVGRGGNRVAEATLSCVTAPLPPFQPDEKAVGQHDGDSMPMKPPPQAALVLVPAQITLGLFVKLFDRMAPMRQAGQLFQGGLHWQVAPEICPLLGLPPYGSLPHQPALVPWPIAGHTPAADGDKLLAQPSLHPPPPANRAPLPTGDRVEQLIRLPHRGGRRRAQAHPEIRPHRDHIPCLPRLQAPQKVGVIAIVGIGHHTPMRHPPRA